MSNPLRQILPRPSGYVHQDDLPPKKDAKAKAACETCRARKTKCDAKRPECSACASRGSKCEYDIDPDITRYTSLKRRYQDLEQEHSELLEVLDMLRNRPEDDAFSILQRIRTSTDMRATMSFIREGNLLTQARVATGMSSSSMSPGSGLQSTYANNPTTLPPLRDMIAELNQGGATDMDHGPQGRSLSSPEGSRYEKQSIGTLNTPVDVGSTIKNRHERDSRALFRPIAKNWPATDHIPIVESLAAFLEKTAASQASDQDVRFCLILCAHMLKDIGNYFPFIGFILHRLLRQAKEQDSVALIDALETIFQDMESRHFMFLSIEDRHSRYTVDLDVSISHPKDPSLTMGLWAAYELWSDTKGKEPEGSHAAPHP